MIILLFCVTLKKLIQAERLRTVLAANAAMVLLCWDIGYIILQRQAILKYMRVFAAAWPDRQIVQQLAAQIPWRWTPTIEEIEAELAGDGRERNKTAIFNCRIG